ncbi:MAG: hypothetical protein JSV66_19250 [Trueperaceae bacterium]|nr:MAG: hypothetical protein JSV66_19250 [Trueperaceae bacterium]
MRLSIRHHLGVALLSCGGLVLEISLTRLLSALYFYHYVYTVLSLAVLGIGLGAALAVWRPSWRTPPHLTRYAGLAGLSVTGLVLVVVLVTSSSQRALLLLALSIPYFFLGLCLTTLFSNAPKRSSSLYAADLIGAGTGALLAVPWLNALGGLDGVLGSAVLLAAASLLFTRRHPWPVLVLPLTVGLFAAGNLIFGWLQLDLGNLAVPKPITSRLETGHRLEASRWDAFARTDLIRDPASRARYLYIDGGAASLVPDASQRALWQGDIGSLPFALRRPENALIIGPGGGLDIALALAGQTGQITAVEINPQSVKLVRELEEYTGNVYAHDDVEVLIDEGRSALRRLEKRFDLIFLSHVISQAAERSGYALSENDLYTVEAFHDYLDHLTPGGQIAVKLYDELTLTRALITAIRALTDRGLSEAAAARHTAAFLDPRQNSPVPLLIIHQEAITPDRAPMLTDTAQVLGFVPLFVPGAVARAPLDGLLAGTVSLSEIIDNAGGVDISPTTDSRPFFYLFELGLPRQLRVFLIGLTLFIVLASALWALTPRSYEHPKLRWSPLYFSGLGIGFMTGEIALLHETRLFLGHPTLALSVVLGTLLIAGGAGSALSTRLSKWTKRSLLGLTPLLVCALFVLWALVWPAMTDALTGAADSVRIAAVVAGTIPLALCLGMPFPLALTHVGQSDQGLVALAWAVNGVMSVAGSLLATVLALSLGFDAVLVAALISYGLAAAYGFWKQGEARVGLAAPDRPM